MVWVIWVNGCSWWTEAWNRDLLWMWDLGGMRMLVIISLLVCLGLWYDVILRIHWLLLICMKSYRVSWWLGLSPKYASLSTFRTKDTQYHANLSFSLSTSRIKSGKRQTRGLEYDLHLRQQNWVCRKCTPQQTSRFAVRQPKNFPGILNAALHPPWYVQTLLSESCLIRVSQGEGITSDTLKGSSLDWAPTIRLTPVRQLIIE